MSLNKYALVVVVVVLITASVGGIAIASQHGNSSNDVVAEYGEGFSLTANKYSYDDNGDQSIDYSIDCKTVKYTDKELTLQINYHKGSKDYQMIANIVKISDVKYKETISIFQDAICYEYIDDKAQWCEVSDNGDLGDYSYLPKDPKINMFYYMAECTVNAAMCLSRGSLEITLDELFDENNSLVSLIFEKSRYTMGSYMKENTTFDNHQYDFVVISGSNVVRSNSSDIIESAQGSLIYIESMNKTIAGDTHFVYRYGPELPRGVFYYINHDLNSNLIYMVSELKPLNDEIYPDDETNPRDQMLNCVERTLVKVTSLSFSDKSSS